MLLRSLYHTGKGEGLTVGRLIICWTWVLALFYSKKALKLNFSHEELHVPNALGKFKMYGKPVGQCFSSTTRGDAQGVRFAPASQVLRHPERWKYIEFEVDDDKWRSIQSWMRALVGRKYDFVGVRGFVIPFVPQNNNEWYCSEICCGIKRRLGIATDKPPISPRRSALLMIEQGLELKGV